MRRMMAGCLEVASGVLADALGENGDGEGLAFDEFLEDEPAGGLAEHRGEVLEGEELDRGCGAA